MNPSLSAKGVYQIIDHRMHLWLSEINALLIPFPGCSGGKVSQSCNMNDFNKWFDKSTTIQRYKHVNFSYFCVNRFCTLLWVNWPLIHIEMTTWWWYVRVALSILLLNYWFMIPAHWLWRETNLWIIKPLILKEAPLQHRPLQICFKP